MSFNDMKYTYFDYQLAYYNKHNLDLIKFERDVKWYRRKVNASNIKKKSAVLIYKSNLCARASDKTIDCSCCCLQTKICDPESFKNETIAYLKKNCTKEEIKELFLEQST